MFKKLIAEANVFLEGAGMPGKLSKKWDRGSRGADSFRSYTKKQTNRARRRAEKKMLDDTPTKMTKGYSHASWPSNPVYTQRLHDKPGAFSSKRQEEGAGSRMRKPMRQAAMMKRQGFEATPARGYNDPDKKAASRDFMHKEPYDGDPLAKRANRHPDDPHTQLVNKLWKKRNGDI